MDGLTMFDILSPGLIQSRSVARILRSSGCIVNGLLMSEEGRIVRPPYHQVHRLQSLPSNCRIVPTGSFSTRQVVDTFGSARLGSVSMGKDELRFMDKQWALEFAESVGLLIPQTWYSPEEASFPAFCKPRIEGSVGPRRVFADLAEVRGYETQPIFQQIVRSRVTIGVAFVADCGVILASNVHRETTSFPAQGGSAVTMELCEDSEAMKQTSRLVQASNFCGWGLAEFKRDEIDGNLYFLEINPKLWASVHFAFANEPKFAELLFGIRLPAKRIMRSTNWHLACHRGPGFLAREAISLVRATPFVDMPAFMNSAIHRLSMYSRSSSAKLVDRE